jgi:hypothetical protein
VRDLVADLCSQRHPTEGEPTLECCDLELLEGALVWGNPDYRKPSAKAPVIDPGDEAPFLVRGGEEERAAKRA